MVKKIDIDSVFGKWTVIGKSDKTDKKKRTYWVCQCNCHLKTIRSIRQDALSRGKSLSCRKKGCFNNLTGKTFDYLFVESININDKTYKYSGNYTKTTYNCLCKCGKYVLVTPEGLLSGNNKSCGCLNIEVTKSRVGPKHPSWKSSITNKERAKRRQDNIPLYTEWRKAVYKRDKHKCVLCKKRGRLNAHHLDGWNWAVGLRYSIPNGVTLCVGCHKNFHAEYGKGGNTRYQFAEFAQRHFNKKFL